jgi:molecular chaperone GrpE
MTDQRRTGSRGTPPLSPEDQPEVPDDILVIEEDGSAGSVELLEEVQGDGGAAMDDAASGMGDDGSPLAEEVARLRKELEEARAAEASAKERQIRALADYDNLRKRTEREKAEQQRHALAATLIEILPVLDNFDAALSAPEGAGGDFRAGVELIARQLTDILGRLGLSEVPAAGAKFDPHHHEAVAREESRELPHNSVARVLRKGYLLRDRLLRPAMVKVAVRPDGEPPPESDLSGTGGSPDGGEPETNPEP